MNNPYTKLANPEALPAGTGLGVSFSHDSTYMAVSHATPPYITIYTDEPPLLVMVLTALQEVDDIKLTWTYE